MCEFFGRSLRKHDKNYSISELKLFSVVEAVTRLRVYLASQKFKIIVENMELTFMNHLKSPISPRLQRWEMFISQFTYDIAYKKGRLNSISKGLRTDRNFHPVITDAFMDDNFVNVVDLEMIESDFNDSRYTYE